MLLIPFILNLQSDSILLAMHTANVPLILMIVAFMIIMACAGDKSASCLEFERVRVSKNVRMCHDKNSPECHVSIDILCSKGKDSVSRHINDAIAEMLFGTKVNNSSMTHIVDSAACCYTKSYINELSKMYREDAYYSTRVSWYEYRYNVSSRIEKGRNGIIVYITTLNYYEGGSHSIVQRLVLNIDPKTGRSVQLADMLVKGYEKSLKEKLLNALMSKTGLNNTDDLHVEGYLYAMGMFVANNYIIGENGITFIYNVFELAPYDKGTIELTLKYTELKDILIK